MQASERSGLVLAGTREMLLPLTVVSCFVLYYLVQVPFAVVGAVAFPMLCLYALAPRWAAQSVERFDRDAVRLLSSRKPAALIARYRRAVGMRLFAPPAVSAERRALVAAENGHAREARAAYREAFRQYAPRPPLRVMLGYAHASYEIRDDEEAIRIYRQLLSTAGALPGVERNLAHAQIRNGESVDEALSILDRISVPPAGQAELSLLRALGHAKIGRRARAEELARSARDARGERLDELREELHDILEPVARPRG